jgi:putative aldouronate transport system substrate-binding protein
MKSPLLLPSTGVFYDSNILSAFGVGKDWYQDAGTVKYGPIQEGYKQYLQMMNQWYSEGLIDPNFVSNTFTDAPANDLLVSEDVMMTTTYWGRVVDAMVVNGITENKDYWLTPIAAAKQKKGDKVGIRMWNSPILNQTVISSSCKNPEIAAKWLDYQYTKDAMILNNYGVEGETFNYDKNGDPQFTDLIMKNPDGLNSTDANRLYIRRNGSGWIDYKRQWLTNPTVAHKDQVWAYDIWSSDGTEQVIPNVTFSTQESKDYSSYYSDIETYVKEMTVNFIMGTTSLDDWDTYVSTIQSMGIEECTKLKQAALDRYNKR